MQAQYCIEWRTQLCSSEIEDDFLFFLELDFPFITFARLFDSAIENDRHCYYGFFLFKLLGKIADDEFGCAPIIDSGKVYVAFGVFEGNICALGGQGRAVEFGLDGAAAPAAEGIMTEDVRAAL